MKVLLINDTTNWYHFGCTATSIALIERIEKLGHFVTSLPITETYKIKSAPLTKAEFLDQNKYQEFAQNNPELMQLIAQHDAIIINGEGTLHGMTPAPRSLLYLAYIAKTVFAKHVEILNHSAYPEHDAFLGNTEEASIYKLVYDIINFAAIREPVSFSVMRNLSTKIGESFDCAPLYIRDHYIRTNIKHNNELLIAGSATWLELNIASNARGNIDDFTIGLSGLNHYLQEMSAQGFKIKFLYGAKANPAKDDQEFIEYMKINFQANFEIYQANSLDDWLQCIEKATILVSGSFHHTIAATCLGTHFIALNSNTPKMEGLMQALGLKKPLLYSDLAIYDKLIKLTKEKLSLKDNAPLYLNALCAKAEKNFEYFLKG